MRRLGADDTVARVDGDAAIVVLAVLDTEAVVESVDEGDGDRVSDPDADAVSVAREEPESDDDALTVGVGAADTVVCEECVEEAVAVPVLDTSAVGETQGEAVGEREAVAVIVAVRLVTGVREPEPVCEAVGEELTERDAETVAAPEPVGLLLEEADLDPDPECVTVFVPVGDLDADAERDTDTVDEDEEVAPAVVEPDFDDDAERDGADERDDDADAAAVRDADSVLVAEGVVMTAFVTPAAARRATRSAPAKLKERAPSRSRGRPRSRRPAGRADDRRTKRRSSTSCRSRAARIAGRFGGSQHNFLSFRVSVCTLHRGIFRVWDVWNSTHHRTQTEKSEPVFIFIFISFFRGSEMSWNCTMTIGDSAGTLATVSVRPGFGLTRRGSLAAIGRRVDW